jgi:hypothetical protein
MEMAPYALGGHQNTSLLGFVQLSKFKGPHVLSGVDHDVSTSMTSAGVVPAPMEDRRNRLLRIEPHQPQRQYATLNSTVSASFHWMLRMALLEWTVTSQSLYIIRQCVHMHVTTSTTLRALDGAGFDDDTFETETDVGHQATSATTTAPRNSNVKGIA